MIRANRSVGDTVPSLSRELVVARRILHEMMPLVVLYKNQQMRTSDSDFLARIGKRNGIDVVACDEETLLSLFADQGIPKRFVDMLSAPALSYAGSWLVCLLLASALGASFIHFRDSDVKLQNRTRRGETEALFPILYEVPLLGRKVSEIKRLKWVTVQKKCRGRVSYVTGLWTGDPPIDASILGAERIRRIFQARRGTEFSRRLLMLSTFAEYESHEIRAQVGLQSRLGLGMNFALGPEYLKVCNPLIPETLGLDDYFCVRFLTRVLGKPGAVHNATIGHYRRARDQRQYASYCVSLLRQVDVDLLLDFVFRRATSRLHRSVSVKRFISSARALFVEGEVHRLRDQRLNRLRNGIAVMQEARCAEIEDALRRVRPIDLVEQIDRSLLEYLDLLTQWKRLVNLADGIDIGAFKLVSVKDSGVTQ